MMAFSCVGRRKRWSFNEQQIMSDFQESFLGFRQFQLSMLCWRDREVKVTPVELGDNEKRQEKRVRVGEVRRSRGKEGCQKVLRAGVNMT